MMVSITSAVSILLFLFLLVDGLPVDIDASTEVEVVSEASVSGGWPSLDSSGETPGTGETLDSSDETGDSSADRADSSGERTDSSGERERGGNNVNTNMNIEATFPFYRGQKVRYIVSYVHMDFPTLVYSILWSYEFPQWKLPQPNTNQA